ncbi:MAG: hypothetical protein ACI9R3_004395 [Verrucomicrobiales bacterium]|jgi:hypothetical protein
MLAASATERRNDQLLHRVGQHQKSRFLYQRAGCQMKRFIFHPHVKLILILIVIIVLVWAISAY